MKIGIIVAMSKELKLLLPLMENAEAKTVGSTTFHIGRIGAHDIALMECGIGKVNAAIGATTLIDAFAPDLVINTGVGAGAGENVAVMDAVIATGVVYHDFWCIGEDWGRVPGCPLVFPTETFAEKISATSCGNNPANCGDSSVGSGGNSAGDGDSSTGSRDNSTGGGCDSAGNGDNSADANVKYGLIASGDMFITSREQVDAIKEHFPEVMAIDMESAAIAQACWQRGVKFFCMRVISDTPWCHHDNSQQYESFWEDAPRQSFGIIRNLIESI